MSYFEEKTHEQIIDDIYENIVEGYDTTLPILNYATFLHNKNKNEKVTVHDWLKRINFEIDLRSTKDSRL